MYFQQDGQSFNDNDLLQCNEKINDTVEYVGTCNWATHKFRFKLLTFQLVILACAHYPIVSSLSNFLFKY